MDGCYPTAEVWNYYYGKLLFSSLRILPLTVIDSYLWNQPPASRVSYIIHGLSIQIRILGLGSQQRRHLVLVNLEHAINMSNQQSSIFEEQRYKLLVIDQVVGHAKRLIISESTWKLP